MKVKKAIELLNIAKHGWPVNDTDDYFIALELGIAALSPSNIAERVVNPSSSLPTC